MRARKFWLVKPSSRRCPRQSSFQRFSTTRCRSRIWAETSRWPLQRSTEWLIWAIPRMTVPKSPFRSPRSSSSRPNHRSKRRKKSWVFPYRRKARRNLFSRCSRGSQSERRQWQHLRAAKTISLLTMITNWRGTVRCWAPSIHFKKSLLQVWRRAPRL